MTIMTQITTFEKLHQPDGVRVVCVSGHSTIQDTIDFFTGEHFGSGILHQTIYAPVGDLVILTASVIRNNHECAFYVFRNIGTGRERAFYPQKPQKQETSCVVGRLELLCYATGADTLYAIFKTYHSPSSAALRKRQSFLDFAREKMRALNRPLTVADHE